MRYVYEQYNNFHTVSVSLEERCMQFKQCHQALIPENALLPRQDTSEFSQTGEYADRSDPRHKCSCTTDSHPVTGSTFIHQQPVPILGDLHMD